MWDNDAIEAKVREVAHKDLPDMRTWSVTEFQAQQLMIMVRTDMQAAYDLRGVHLDAAHHHIATLERAIVVGGPTLRAIREEIEGGNDE